MAEKAFQGDGKFDAEKFKHIIRDAGYTERVFPRRSEGRLSAQGDDRHRQLRAGAAAADDRGDPPFPQRNPRYRLYPAPGLGRRPKPRPPTKS